ncbi:MAG TPA: asparagine synthase (glutamine-hydrolyzing) [Tepidisphaeraceae bacterium]|nr:asparagine synthase (glutamine-hydrolyzing) [Tepidisphaeraceae bacterium]
MCGIAGLFDRNASPAAQIESAVAAMTAALRHRGPDDEGFSTARVGGHLLALGQRRLAIQDLSAAGHQPMAHPAGSQLVFNGEIYNVRTLRTELESLGHRFVGQSDTEVLLHGLERWGTDYLRRLCGMYTLAFHDARHDRLLLARDPLGIKPLYVADVGGRLLFASEVRALLASGLVSREPDPRGVAGLLAYGAVQQPATLFREIASFPPGCYAVYDATPASGKPVPFWRFPPPDPTVTEPGAVERVRQLADEAVRDHLISDVPVGVFLSSGLDSTIIAALAARHTRHLRSFTVGFADQPDLSELALARETAGLFGLDHTEIDITGSEAEAATLEWLDALDQPSVDGLNVFLISKVTRAHGIKVALSGQGGDELFGGYPSFADVPRLRRVLAALSWVPPGLRRTLCRLAATGRSEAVRQKLLDIAGTDGGTAALALQRRRAMSDAQLAALGITPAGLGLDASFQVPGAFGALPLEAGDVTHAVSVLESACYQGNMLLRDSDANGMAHGLEIRVPLLDQRLIDYAYAIPGPVRLPSGRADKHLLRRAFFPELRASLLQQRKRGFTLPIRRWMTGPLRGLCEDALSELKRQPMIRPDGVDAVWRSFLTAPESPIWSRAFSLVVLGYYLRSLRPDVHGQVLGARPVTRPVSAVATRHSGL